jgi:YidC/Oxa1 family membrane protein insertase
VSLMDDQNKNLILATVLSFLVILVWFTLFAPPPETVAPNSATSVAGQPADVTGGAVAGSNAQPATAEPAAANSAEPNAAASAETAPDALVSAPRVSIDTPRLAGTLSLLGGRMDDLSLKDYRVSLKKDSPDVRLLEHSTPGDAIPVQPYYAVYGWSPAGGMDPKLVPDANTLWQVESGSVLTPETPITLRWDNGAGLIFHRKIEVDKDYLFTITQSVDNQSAAAVRLSAYGIVVRKGAPKVAGTYVSHEGVVSLADGKLEEITYKKVTKLEQITGEGQAEKLDITTGGWIGFADKYWMTALVPTPGDPFTSVVKYVPSAELYQTETRMPVIDVAPGVSASSATMLFAGAKEWEVIKGYQKSKGIDRFVDAIDWGWFYFLTKPMFQLLHWLHGVIGNMGWAIIALTFIIKALVFPLARKSYVSMAKMKELQPEMEALKARVGDDRQKMQQEMMALYKREKVNPASGCLPILLQIPIFFSLYKVIYNTIELYQAPFIGWIHDLSAPDPSSILNLFGLLPWATPEHGSALFILSLGVLPILLGISMWFQQKLNPAPTDATQAAIFAWMPWIFMFMLGSFASGLVLYWITNNTITFLQQYTIMSMHGKRPDLFGNIASGFKRDKTGAK